MVLVTALFGVVVVVILTSNIVVAVFENVHLVVFVVDLVAFAVTLYFIFIVGFDIVFV